MKKISIQILSILVILIVILNFNITVFATTQSDLNKQKDEINDKIQNAQDDLTNIQNEKSETLKQVESLIIEISGYDSQISTLKTEINDIQKEIEETQKQIDEKQKEYDEQSELLDQRMIAVYENGETSYLDFILSSKSLVEFISNYYLAAEIASCDTDLIDSINKTKNEIQDKKSSLENKKLEIDNKLKEVETISSKMKISQMQKNEKVESLTKEEKQTQADLEQLQAENNKITKELKDAEERYKKQLEELKNKENGNGVGSGFLQAPVRTGSITATMRYSNGSYHGALDYGVPIGTTVYAAADGVVLTASYAANSYGYHIVIQHTNGLRTYYAHGNGTYYVSPGETVKKGQPIMQSGNSGKSSGPHLHFEVRLSPYSWSIDGNDSRVDPRTYM